MCTSPWSGRVSLCASATAWAGKNGNKSNKLGSCSHSGGDKESTSPSQNKPHKKFNSAVQAVGTIVVTMCLP